MPAPAFNVDVIDSRDKNWEGTKNCEGGIPFHHTFLFITKQQLYSRAGVNVCFALFCKIYSLFGAYDDT